MFPLKGNTKQRIVVIDSFLGLNSRRHIAGIPNAQVKALCWKIFNFDCRRMNFVAGYFYYFFWNMPIILGAIVSYVSNEVLFPEEDL